MGGTGVNYELKWYGECQHESPVVTRVVLAADAPWSDGGAMAYKTAISHPGSCYRDLLMPDNKIYCTPYATCLLLLVSARAVTRV